MSKDRGYLLLIEDDRAMQLLNAEILKQNGYSVKHAYTLNEAREIIKKEPPRGIVLDVKLPDGNGFDFLKEFRKISQIPVLILTALSGSDDIVYGLSVGSDDYIVKPYDFSVFLSRIDSMLRRAESVPEILEYGPFKLYPSSGIALHNGDDMFLAQKEYSVLQLLIQQLLTDDTDEALSAEYIYEKVWMQEMVDNKKSLKQTIFRLREKLTDSVYTISNSRGKGYFLEII